MYTIRKDKFIKEKSEYAEGVKYELECFEEINELGVWLVFYFFFFKS